MNDNLKFKIVEANSMIFLECNGDYVTGYNKPLQKTREEVIKEFKDRITQCNGILEED